MKNTKIVDTAVKAVKRSVSKYFAVRCLGSTISLGNLPVPRNFRPSFCLKEKGEGITDEFLEVLETFLHVDPPKIPPPPLKNKRNLLLIEQCDHQWIRKIVPGTKDNRPTLASLGKNNEFISRQIVFLFCTTWRTMFAHQLRSEEKQTNRTSIIGRKKLKVSSIRLSERVRKIPNLSCFASVP